MVRSQTRLPAQGFTLLEVLVTIVIISIGLLGLLGLQTVSLANTQISAARSQASVAANNIADRMRANPLGAQNGHYEFTPPGAKNKDCSKTECTDSKDMARFDTWQWNRSLQNQSDEGTTLQGLLPNGRGYIDCLPSGASPCQTYRITIAWRERNLDAEGSPADTCNKTGITDRCFQTVVRP